MSGMTSDRIEELRRIAEAATPGKRVVFVPEGRQGHEWLILQVDGSVSNVITVINKWARNMSTMDYCDADAEFFTAFDPPTVLAMLDEIERLRRVEWWARRICQAHQDVEQIGYAQLRRAINRLSEAINDVDNTLALLDGEKGGDGA